MHGGGTVLGESGFCTYLSSTPWLVLSGKGRVVLCTPGKTLRPRGQSPGPQRGGSPQAAGQDFPARKQRKDPAPPPLPAGKAQAS